jgi:hypothetical protein
MSVRIPTQRFGKNGKADLPSLPLAQCWAAGIVIAQHRQHFRIVQGVPPTSDDCE